MKTVGLSGVMGAGKSSVIEVLHEKGIPVLDCDTINAQLLCKGKEGYTWLVHAFGTEILDASGDIDKQMMSELLFCNRDSKQKVEAILHPCIQKEMVKQLKIHKDKALVVVEVPLLFEVKWEHLFDEVWVVASDKEHIMKRLMHQRGIAKEEIKRRLAAQMPQEMKIQKADIVIYNNGDKANLKQQIYDILKVYK